MEAVWVSGPLETVVPKQDSGTPVTACGRNNRAIYALILLEPSTNGEWRRGTWGPR